MDTHSHTNGHAKKASTQGAHAGNAAIKVATKTVRRAKKKAVGLARTAERRVDKVVAAGPKGLSKMAHDTFAWVKENPKSAVGILVGGGVIFGVLAGTKVGRSALYGLGSIATFAIRRFV